MPGANWCNPYLQYRIYVTPMVDKRPCKSFGESTILEISFLTKLSKLTNVHSNASLCLLHPDVLCKMHTRIDPVKKVHFKVVIENTLEDILSHKLHFSVLFAKYRSKYFNIKYVLMTISKFGQFSYFSFGKEFPKMWNLRFTGKFICKIYTQTYTENLASIQLKEQLVSITNSIG